MSLNHLYTASNTRTRIDATFNDLTTEGDIVGANTLVVQGNIESVNGDIIAQNAALNAGTSIQAQQNIASVGGVLVAGGASVQVGDDTVSIGNTSVTAGDVNPITFQSNTAQNCVEYLQVYVNGDVYWIPLIPNNPENN